jgi:hypothetical protein
VTSRGGFYVSLAQSILDRALEAMRSCLSPQFINEREATAFHLEAILRRFTDLLIADDALTALALEEGTAAADVTSRASRCTTSTTRSACSPVRSTPSPGLSHPSRAARSRIARSAGARSSPERAGALT